VDGKRVGPFAKKPEQHFQQISGTTVHSGNNQFLESILNAALPGREYFFGCMGMSKE
jgi:hypothetical protein